MAVRVGIDVAAFTECQVLSPASWLDFSARIRELLECGRRAAALQLWDSVCEIVHLGSPCSTFVLQVQGMPPLLQVPCCNENCRRCEEHRGGFQFPWLGTWSRRAVLVQSGAPLNEAWASYHLNEEKLDLLAIQFMASPMSREDILPDHVARMLQLLATQPTGGYPLDAAWEATRSWQLGHRRRREPWRVGRPMPGAPSLITERPSLRWSSSPNHAPFAAHLVSPIASFAAARSAENATSSGRFVPSVQVLVQISLAAYVMSQGRYAMEAAGHVEGWDPQNATEILAEQRAREFRRQFHLESDEDLAFAFESFEDAKQAGGTAFAIQWVEARHSAQANLLGDAAEVIESSAGSARDKPALERKPQPSRGKGVTLSRSAFEPEHVTRRVDALALVFFEAGVFRPSMRTEATTVEQKKAIERLYAKRRWQQPSLSPSTMPSGPGGSCRTSWMPEAAITSKPWTWRHLSREVPWAHPELWTAWSGWTSMHPCAWSWRIWCCPLRHRWGREPATKPWWSNLRCWPSLRGGSKTSTTARTRSGRPFSAVGWLLLESCDTSTLWGLNPWGCRDPPCTCSATRGSRPARGAASSIRVVCASHLQHWLWLGSCSPRGKTQASSCSERHCRACVQRGGRSMGFVRMPERMPSLV